MKLTALLAEREIAREKGEKAPSTDKLIEIGILLLARQGERKIWREVAFERKDRVADYRPRAIRKAIWYEIDTI